MWFFYAIFIWFIGGSLVLHYINPWMSAIDMYTTPGHEPLAMILISVAMGAIGVVGWYVYEYIKSVINRSNK
jgi:predicted MFS family arabinose efflux permease